MAKVQIKSEKLTPFGGFFSIVEQFDALLAQTRPEGTFGSLRYAFGGDHPSQTTHQAVSSH